MPPKKRNASSSVCETRTRIQNQLPTLVIVESPAKCKKIEEYLGENYKCLASFGHIREIRSLKDIDETNGFKINFTQQIERIKRTAVRHLHDAMKSCGEVIIATDDDREGEAIGWHLCEILKLDVNTTPRILFHEITRQALLSAVNNPKRINMDLVRAQHCRQVIDMLVGFKVSPVLWGRLTYGKNSKGSLSAGRCQTPSLRLVYDNYVKILEQSKSKMDHKYKVYGLFTSCNLKFSLSHKFDKEEDVLSFLKTTSETNHSHILSRSKPQTSMKRPPTPLTTSRLQQICSNECSLSPKDTMMCAQKLYERGLITYMRTDAKKYSAEFVDSVTKFIVSKYNDEKYVSSKISELCGSDSKSDDEGQHAHESIRPTNIRVESAGSITDISPRECKVYSIIWRITLETCMSDAIYSRYACKLSSPLSSAKYVRNVENAIFLGWEIVRSTMKAIKTSGGKSVVDNEVSDSDEIENYEDGDGGYAFLNTLVEDSPVDFSLIRADGVVERSINHYTEARLVQILEDKGIGRPSTFSSLVDKIQERGYVKKMNVDGINYTCTDLELSPDGNISLIEKTSKVGSEKGKLVIQPLGIMVVEYLLKHFSSLFEYEYTSNMEKQLELVSSGENNWTTVCETVNKDIINTISSLSDGELKKINIKIDNEHTYIVGKHGPVVKRVCADPETSKQVTTFLPIRSDLDLSIFDKTIINLSDIIDIPSSQKAGSGSDDDSENKMEYDEKSVTVKKGKYGLYVKWGDVNISLKGFGNRPPENIRMDEIIGVLDAYKVGGGSGIVRQLNKDTSVRTNKQGLLYIFYKTDKMKKPAFFKMPKGITKENLDEYEPADILNKLDV